MKSLATLLVVSFTLGAAFMLCAYAGQARTAQAAAQPAAHPSLPSWVHWAPASSGAAREVCGRGVAAFTVWGGSGGTSAVVCADGKAETS